MGCLIKEMCYLSHWSYTCNNLREMGWRWSNLYWVYIFFPSQYYLCSTILWPYLLLISFYLLCQLPRLYHKSLGDFTGEVNLGIEGNCLYQLVSAFLMFVFPLSWLKKIAYRSLCSWWCYSVLIASGCGVVDVNCNIAFSL